MVGATVGILRSSQRNLLTDLKLDHSKIRQKLEAAQQRYSTFDGELLAVFLALRHFRFMLEGRKFCIFTHHHRPLVGALGRVSEPWTTRQQRQLSYISEFSAELKHISGESNTVADTLSRPPSPPSAPGSVATLLTDPTAPPAVDLHQMAAAQASCANCSACQSSPSLRVSAVPIPVAAGRPGSTTILADSSTGVLRPLVPAAFRRAVFSSVHELAHPGIRASRGMISSRFLWPHMAADIARWCQECQHCSRAKVTMQHKSAVQPIAVPLTRFTHVHVDLVGPLPAAADGSCYILTAVDRITRWMEATPLATITAEACIAALTTTWSACYGLPAAITTDRGAQFTSGAWGSFLSRGFQASSVPGGSTVLDSGGGAATSPLTCRSQRHAVGGQEGTHTRTANSIRRGQPQQDSLGGPPQTARGRRAGQPCGAANTRPPTTPGIRVASPSPKKSLGGGRISRQHPALMFIIVSNKSA
jgi:hypothetical protein